MRLVCPPLAPDARRVLGAGASWVLVACWALVAFDGRNRRFRATYAQDATRAQDLGLAGPAA